VAAAQAVPVACFMGLTLVAYGAGGTGRGVPLLLAVLALLVVRFLPPVLVDSFSDEVSEKEDHVATGVFVRLAGEDRFVYARRGNGDRLFDVVFLDTNTEPGARRLSYEPELPVAVAASGSTTFEALIRPREDLASLQADYRLLYQDIDAAAAGAERLVRLAAPYFAVAGLLFIARLSRWPALGGSLVLLLSRGSLVLYRFASGDKLRPLTARFGDWSHLFPSMVLLALGIVLIGADLLTTGSGRPGQGGADW
jgi:hypothetical protein